MNIPILYATLFSLSLPLHAAVMLEDYQFGDSAGTGLKSVTNSGTSGNTWNFNIGGAPGEGATDGTGNLVIGADATSGSSAITKDYTRKVEFTTTVTGSTYGDYVFEVSVGDIDLAGAAGDGELGEKEGLNFKLIKANGDSVNMTVELNSNGVDPDALRTRHSTSGASVGGTAANKNFGTGAVTTSNGVVLKIEGNLVTGEFDTYWRRETGTSSTYTAIIIDGTGLTDIDEIMLGIEADDGTSNTAGWGTNDNMNLDFLTLEVTAVPEPSSATLLGLGALALTLRRKK